MAHFKSASRYQSLRTRPNLHLFTDFSTHPLRKQVANQEGLGWPRGGNVYIYIYMYTHIHIYRYIYTNIRIYTFRGPHILSWVAVKELELSYYIRETLLFTIYTHYGNLIQVP